MMTTESKFERTMQQISKMYHAGRQNSPAYQRLIDQAWKLAPPDVVKIWLARAMELQLEKPET